MAPPAALYRKCRIETWLVAGGLGMCAVFAIVQRLLLSDGNLPDYTHLLGVPLDDVFIHCRYAFNLLHGFGFSFNPPDVVTADTSPLWVLLVAVGGLLTPHLELIAILCSMICYLIVAPGVYRTARDLLGLSERNARLAGWATVLSSRLVWSAMSGMETALAVLLMLLAVEAHLRARSRNCIDAKEVLWVALGLLARPEFYFVVIVFLLDWLYAKIKDNADLSRGGLAVMLLVAIGAPAIFLPLVTNGQLIAHSALVQRALPHAGSGITLLHAEGILAEPNIILFALLVIGITRYWKDKKLIALTVIVFTMPIAQSIVAPQLRHHGRYLFPLYPIIILLAIKTWDTIEHREWPWERMRRLAPVIIIIVSILSCVRWSYLAASDVRNINDQHLAVVQWLRQNMRLDDTLAVGDVGAAGYYLNRRIIDVTGLVTPTLWLPESRQDSVWNRARAMGANLFVIYPRWSPAFFEAHKDSLLFIRSFSARLPITSSADTALNVYRLKERHNVP